jgi:hypothetical protein
LLVIKREQLWILEDDWIAHRAQSIRLLRAANRQIVVRFTKGLIPIKVVATAAARAMTGLEVDPPQRLKNGQVNPIADQLAHERHRWLEALRRWISESRLHPFNRFGQAHRGPSDDDAFVSLEELQSLTMLMSVSDPDLPEDMAHVSFGGPLAEQEDTTRPASTIIEPAPIDAFKTANAEPLPGNSAARESTAERLERRYNAYIAIGGGFVKANGEWRLTGGVVDKLREDELKAGRSHTDRKTIRKDLKQAHDDKLEAERTGKASPWSGMGRRGK